MDDGRGCGWYGGVRENSRKLLEQVVQRFIVVLPQAMGNLWKGLGFRSGLVVTEMRRGAIPGSTHVDAPACKINHHVIGL